MTEFILNTLNGNRKNTIYKKHQMGPPLLMKSNNNDDKSYISRPIYIIIHNLHCTIFFCDRQDHFDFHIVNEYIRNVFSGYGHVHVITIAALYVKRVILSK